MRKVLVDHARGHSARKRGGGWARATLSEEMADAAGMDLPEILALDAGISARCGNDASLLPEVQALHGAHQRTWGILRALRPETDEMREMHGDGRALEAELRLLDPGSLPGTPRFRFASTPVLRNSAMKLRYRSGVSWVEATWIEMPDSGERIRPASTPRAQQEQVMDPALRARLTALFEEGWEIWDRFDVEVRRREWHPFVHGDYEGILRTLLAQGSLPAGQKFLEWGSATGVITIMADLLGFEAYGIELDADLVRVARGLARRHGSSARFVHGSFLPSGYRWKPKGTDDRAGTIGEGESAYPELGHPLDDFDLVFAYPWYGEEALMLDLMARYGGREATLLMQGSAGDVQVFRRGGVGTPGAG
jgi:hypothetical protein